VRWRINARSRIRKNSGITKAPGRGTASGIQIHVDGAGSDPRPALREIVALIEQHRLRVPIWRTFPLAQTAAALDASNTGHLNGKIVVLP